MATTITNYAGLVAIADDLAGDYVLGDDIDASGETFTPLGTFTGTLDGKDYKVKDLTITVSGADSQYAGFIITNQGAVSNLGLVDCVISCTSTSGSAGTAAVAGSLICKNNAAGTIYHCYSSGTITVTDNYGWGARAGGLIWENRGAAEHSYAKVAITATGNSVTGGGFADENRGSTASTTECFATGSLTLTGTASAEGGGFVWANLFSGVNTDCYAMGDITTSGTSTKAAGFMETNNGTSTNCYSKGKPTAKLKGGFCQENNGTITACFFDKETSGCET